MIVGSMGTNPIPEDAVRIVFTKCAVMETHAGRPHLAHLLEADGRMPWIGLEKLEVLVGEFTDGLRELSVMEPELRRCEVIQSGVQRPAS